MRSHNLRTLPEDVLFSGTIADLAGIPRRRVDGFALQRLANRVDCVDQKPRAYSFHLNGDAANFDRAAGVMAMLEANATVCTSNSRSIV